MSGIRITAMPFDVAVRMRRGEADDYGLAPERGVSAGGAMPCRHCLDHIAAGESYLTFAYRPFPALQPYAETGPVFLHASDCPGHAADAGVPPVLRTSPDYILRGYGSDHRIVYGTGAVTAASDIVARAAALLARPEIAYLHVRSSRNNCYQCRIDRA